MSSFSNISIVGNLTRDPQMFIFNESGRKKTTMTVAVNNWIKGKNNKLEKTADFYKVETWDTLAQLTSDYLTKGSQVAVSGRLHMETWKDNAGKERVTPTVKANQIALPQKGTGKSPDAAVLSKTETIIEKDVQAASVLEGDEYDPNELPPSEGGPSNGQLANAQSLQTDDSADDDVEISENDDFSEEGSSSSEEVPQPSQPQPSQFSQTMKVVETTTQNPPTVSSIARSA
jgi:single stranded DNA-binding protein (ssb)